MSRGSFIARRRRPALGALLGAAAICASVVGCSIEDGALQDDERDLVSEGGTGGATSQAAPEDVSPELCAEDQHVEDHGCVPCPGGLDRPAGDDPTGEDTECSEPVDSQGEPEEPNEPGELGAPCGGNDACASEHCVDGVCCESACDGPCMACSGAGLCDVAPVDDEACGVIFCPVGAQECLLYNPAITANRCRGFGECKTADDCVVEHQPRGTQCTLGDSPYSVCVEGQCALPSVLCGAGTCAIGSGSGDPRVCCNYPDHQSCTSICADTHLTAPEPETSIYCDEQEDCRPGTRCALLIAAGGSRIFCTDDPDFDGTFLDHHEVCDSPAMDPVACSNGAACDMTSSLFEGWAFCSHA